MTQYSLVGDLSKTIWCKDSPKHNPYCNGVGCTKAITQCQTTTKYKNNGISSILNWLCIQKTHPPPIKPMAAKLSMMHFNPEWKHCKNEDKSWTKKAEGGHDGTPKPSVGSTQKCRKVGKRARQWLCQSKALKELLFSKPLGYNFILQHGNDDNTSAKDQAPHPAKDLKDF